VHCGNLAEARFRSRRSPRRVTSGALGKAPRSDSGIVQGPFDPGRTRLPRRLAYHDVPL